MGFSLRRLTLDTILAAGTVAAVTAGLASPGYANSAAPKDAVAAIAAPAIAATPMSAVDKGSGVTLPTSFIAASAAPAQRSQREWKVPASVTIAQAILESGWGRSGLSRNDHNYFGIKCTTRGPLAIGCRSYPTTEVLPDGTSVKIKASFRVYASAADSFSDHGRFLATSSRYRAAFRYTTDPNRFIAEVAKAGYATSPTYAAHIQRLIATYQLDRYDLR